MKRLKFLLVFAFLLVGSLTALAFTSDSYHKVIGSTCLKWKMSEDPWYDKIQLLDPANWGHLNPPPAQDLYTTCDGIDELCAICFQTTNTTADQARNLLYVHYRDYGQFPSSDVITGPNGQRVWVYLKVIDIND